MPTGRSWVAEKESRKSLAEIDPREAQSPTERVGGGLLCSTHVSNNPLTLKLLVSPPALVIQGNTIGGNLRTSQVQRT